MDFDFISDIFTGLSIYEGYAQTETTLMCGVCRSMAIRPGSMGKAAPGYNLKVLNKGLVMWNV